MNEEKKNLSESEKLMEELEPIYCMIDEGGPIHPTEYDESDDLEAVKKIIEKRKNKEKFVKEILSDQKLAKGLNTIAERLK